MGGWPADFVTATGPTVTWMPRLAARWSGRSAATGPEPARRLLVLKGMTTGS
jgi:hypothetical protein